MMKPKISKLFYGIAIVIIGLGIVSLGLEMMMHKKIIDAAVLKGATSPAISEYIWQQVVPSILKSKINVLGFSTLIFGMGVLTSRPRVHEESFVEMIEEDYSDFESVDKDESDLE